MISETPLRKAIQVAATLAGARLFRNNTGRLQDKTGRWVTFGLGVGGSDLIGFTAEGLFCAIEIKVGRTPVTVEQRRFISSVNAAGGRAGVARSVEDALAILTDGNGGIM